MGNRTRKGVGETLGSPWRKDWENHGFPRGSIPSSATYMDIKNLTGLEKPLIKLIETISEGVGVLGNHAFEFDAAKIKRVGKAEAEAEKEKIIKKSEAQEKTLEILGRAGKRFALEQYSKQINLENILVKSREDLLGKEVSDEKVEKDWTMKFLDIAQNISREDIQDILAKILSGEIQQPGKYSYQTLETVKYLSSKNIEVFLKFVAISTMIGVIKLFSNGKDSLKRYDLEFEDYLDLSSVGLFNQSSTLSYSMDLNKEVSGILIDVGTDEFLISKKPEEETKHFNLGLFVFSNTGKELRSLLLPKAVNGKADLFKEDLVKEVEKNGFDIIKK